MDPCPTCANREPRTSRRQTAVAPAQDVHNNHHYHSPSFFGCTYINGCVIARFSHLNTICDHAFDQAAVVDPPRYSHLFEYKPHRAPNAISNLLLTSLRNAGDLKDIEVYSCHVSPDGKRLATAAGGPYAHNRRARTRCAAPNNVTDRVT